MSPSFKRILPALLLTIFYWPAALMLLGISLMGDCFETEAVCDASFRTTLGIELAVAITFYAWLLFKMLRKSTR